MVAALNSVRAEGIHLVASEGDGAAGTYAGSVVLPAGAYLIDVIVHNVALWNAGTSASLEVGDSADADGIFTAVNLKATDLLAGESISFAMAGGQQGADVDDIASGAQVRRRYTGAERTITATVTCVGTAATTGETDVIVVYAFPSPVGTTFTAA